MAKNNVADLLSVGSLFTTQAERDEAQRETVRDIPLEEISDFPNHPFKVRMDESMMEMVDSVKQYGVLVPALVRPKPDGGYEMIAGHRRRMASELAEKPTLSCIVRDMTDDEATIVMVDSNLQREQILPSEKAFAYKLKLDAMKRQGQRSDLTCATPLHKFSGKKSRDVLAEQTGESHEQIRKYVRLTHLIPTILDLVDNSVLKEKEMLQIALRPAVELSYLRKEEQADLFAIMDEMDCTPSHAQAIKMRQMSEAKTGDERLAKDALVAIMKEEKPNQKEQFKIPKEKISRFFAPGTPTQKIEDTIVKALELYRNGMKTVDDMKALIHYAALGREGSPSPDSQDQDAVALICRYVAGHLQDELRREELAEAAHLNPDYLNRLFKKEMGLTLKEYVIRQKMEEARSLLRTTALPVSLIAAKVGYSNFAHFSASYKKLYGRSPQEERQNTP